MESSDTGPIIIVGLGNPGWEYEKTRHNLGFMVVEEIRRKLQSRWKAGDGQFLFSRAEVGEVEILLVKPLTFMNNSGEAVCEVLEKFAAPICNMLVAVDDMAIGLGTIRIRAKGTHGGHNGLRSIIYHLNTHEFARVRCGIKTEPSPAKLDVSDFVLSPFSMEESESVTRMIGRAADAAIEFAVSGIGKTMNKFNTALNTNI